MHTISQQDEIVTGDHSIALGTLDYFVQVTVLAYRRRHELPQFLPSERLGRHPDLFAVDMDHELFIQFLRIRHSAPPSAATEPVDLASLRAT